MRIISNFRDYYDSIMSYGTDSSLLYKRHSKKEDLLDYPFPVVIFYNFNRWDRNRSKSPAMNVAQVVIGFCGKVHLVLLLSPHSISTDLIRSPNSEWAYSIHDVDKFVKTHFPKNYDYYTETVNKKNTWKWDLRRKNFDRIFTQWSEQEDKYKDWFSDCPIFTVVPTRQVRVNTPEVTRGVITRNACLKDYEFYRVKDAYQTYQELSMWLGNQAEPRKPIPTISDETMVEIKGFDKFSFRKDATKHK